ncbi:MAG: neuraminidase-like domain-containing protein, partial [Flavisolibacter sp.]
FQMPEVFILENFSGIFDNVNGALQVLLNPLAALNEKLVLLYTSYIPLLKKKLRQDAIVQHIASLIGLTEDLTAILVNTGLSTLMNTLATQGYNSVYYSDINFNVIALERVDPEINFTWNDDSPDPAVPADNFSVRWNSYLAVPASGDYTLIIEVSEPDESFQLFLDDIMILEKTSGDAMTSWEIAVTLNSSQLHKIMVGYVELSQNAGVSLYWKTVTSSRQIIPSSFLYPTAIVDSFASLATLYHRAAQFIDGFKLTERELGHFISYNIDFDNIDFNALTSVHWKRINDYVFLRNRVPQAQISLIDIFSTANKPAPAPTIIELTDLVYNATAWDYLALTHLIQNYFTVNQNDFKNEKLFLRILRAIQLVQKTGISIMELAKWAIPEIDFNNLNDTAQSVKSTVKAKYEEADWLSVAGGLSDKIRRNQQQALISYLITRTELRNWGAVDADGLFEYFLIDVQMGACMDTSRIVQANSSVQMFVNRCLLNLESKKSSTGVEHGVSPSSIDSDRWEWMKYYRVWEANRKVFLYPENWLEPEWRDDRSPFFKELESELVQNDITDRSVENAFRNYLTKLNGVANLEVCGSIQEYDDHNMPVLYHVIGRTNTIPYQYYYRTWTNTYRKWTPWDKVGVDIRSVDEGDKDNDKSGVHVIPVIWKKRLFLFWPEFIKGQEEPSTGNKTGWATLDETVSSFKAKAYWEVKLAWSEYIDGKWAPKQFTKECAFTNEPHPKNLSYSSEVDETSQELTITGWVTKYFAHRHYFTFADIQSPVHIHYPQWTVIVGGVNLYVPSFMKIGRTSTLRFLDNEYLKKSLAHKLLFSNHITDFESKLKYPFFYTAKKRSFFVRPINIRVVEAVVEPEKASPFLPGNIVDDSGWNIPIDIPDIGEDDRRDHVINFQDTGVIEMDINPQFNTSMEGFESEENVLRSATFNNKSTITNRSSMQSSSEYEAEAHAVGESFGGLQVVDKSYGAITNQGYGALQMQKGLEFHTFYHPYSSLFVTRLNQGNVEGLMESDTVLPGDGGAKFINRYQPDATYVPKQPDFKKRTYYKENVCFDVYGANSIYNWELFFHAPLYI